MQQNTGEHWLQALDRETLTPLVRKALNSDSAEITTWDCRPLLGGLGDWWQGLQGLYRFAGTGRDHGEAMNWSLILKFSRTPAHGGDPQGGQRERLAYQSGFLENLSGVAAPRCFGLVEMPQGLSLLWLEEVTDLYGKWPLERYGLAARHLGQLNGAWLTGKPLPTWPWLSRNWLRSWVAQAAPVMARFPDAVKHPVVQRYYPPDIEAGFLHLWDERELLLNALDRLPQTFCHLDAFRRNLLARRDANGQEQTVAIDWAFAGIAAAGEELAPLILASVGFHEVELADLDALDETVFNGYLEGLRDTGWQGDPRAVRFGYAAAGALRYGVGIIGVMVSFLMDENYEAKLEQIIGLTVEEDIALSNALNRYQLKLAREALNLLKDIV